MFLNRATHIYSYFHFSSLDDVFFSWNKQSRSSRTALCFQWITMEFYSAAVFCCLTIFLQHGCSRWKSLLWIFEYKNRYFLWQKHGWGMWEAATALRIKTACRMKVRWNYWVCCSFNDVFSNCKRGYCTVWTVMIKDLRETCKGSFCCLILRH